MSNTMNHKDKNSASLLTLRNGDTWMMRIRRNIAFFTLRIMVPDLVPPGLGKQVIVLNLPRARMCSWLEQDQKEAEQSCGSHEPPGKSLLYWY